jgi:ActR/RegA family two-component response regulator
MLNHEAARAIIVDDDHSGVQVLRPLLEAMGYHVSVAQDPYDGLAILRASQQKMLVLFHVDLTGYTLSGLDSVLILGALLRDASLARHAYILTTESPYAVVQVFDRILARFEVPVLAKPVDAAEVRAAFAMAAGRLGIERTAEPALDGIYA